MKILVLGGTGAMGVHLVELLSKSKNEVYVTTRRVINSTDNVYYIQGNAKKNEFLNTLLDEEWDAIVDFMVYSTKDFKNRIDLLLKSTKQYVFLSSARVFAESQDPISENSSRLLDVCEDKEYLKTGEYAITKAEQEDILSGSKYNNWTVVRPYITYSENRFQLGVLEKEEWLYRALKGRSIIFSVDINKKLTTLTYGFDVAKGIEAVIGKNEAYGQFFNITNGKSFKWEYVLDIYLNELEDYLGYKPNVILQDIDTFLEWKQSKYQIKFDRLYDREFNNHKISNFIDTSSFMGIEDGLKKSIQSFLINAEFKDIDWKKEALKDKLVKENTSLLEIRRFKSIIKYLLYRYNILK